MTRRKPQAEPNRARSAPQEKAWQRMERVFGHAYFVRWGKEGARRKAALIARGKEIEALEENR